MSSTPLFTSGDQGALLSDCGRYRYRLWRIWDDLAPLMVWVMLNPSIADARQDDPTIRKCIGFAKRHHHGGIIVVNLFAWRATYPKELAKVAEPVGPENDDHIRWACRAPLMATIVAGWGGVTRQQQRRATSVSVNLRAHRALHCFGTTARGEPRHPLMLPYSTSLQVFP